MTRRWWWPFGQSAKPAPTASVRPDDGLVVVEYTQDADSFGWAVTALFCVDTGVRRRWGIMAILINTSHGADLNPRWFQVRSAADVVRNAWHLADWHVDEAAARAALEEARSRIW